MPLASIFSYLRSGMTIDEILAGLGHGGAHCATRRGGGVTLLLNMMTEKVEGAAPSWYTNWARGIL